jgi:hypothetical protein
VKLLPCVAAFSLLLPSVALADDPSPAPPQPPPEAAPPAPAPPPAAPAPPAKAWHIDLTAGTQFPASVGAMTSFELPYRILLQLDLGFMPEPYAATINDFLKAIGTYDETVSQLISAALGNSFVMRAAAGFRPFERHGFEVLAGYTLVTLGGSLSGAEVLQTLLQEKGSASRIPSDAGNQIPLRATLHSFQISLGWRWLFLDDRLVLRASLSYLQCVAASTNISFSSTRPAEQAAEAKINQEIDGYLTPYFTTYIKAPVAGLSFGYRF